MLAHETGVLAATTVFGKEEYFLTGPDAYRSSCRITIGGVEEICGHWSI